MRAAIFTLALAALVFTSVDFWLRTRRQIEQARELRTDIARLVDDGLARARQSGAPPTLGEVEAARAAAKSLAQDATALRSAWYADAARPADYLLPRAARPASDALGAERERIAQVLLTLPAEVKTFPGLSAARLGLVAPSLTDSFPTDPAALADQAERAAATRLLVAALRSTAAVRVEDAALQRVADAGLVLRLEAVAAISDAVALFEHLVASSDEAPPRRLKRFELARQPPRNWGAHGTELKGPPVRVSIALGFDFPVAASGAAR